MPKWLSKAENLEKRTNAPCTETYRQTEFITRSAYCESLCLGGRLRKRVEGYAEVSNDLAAASGENGLPVCKSISPRHPKRLDLLEDTSLAGVSLPPCTKHVSLLVANNLTDCTKNTLLLAQRGTLAVCVPS